jgi:hypothetical protein
MIEKILNKFGYSKVVRDLEKEPFTEQEICELFSSIIGDVYETTFPKQDELKLFADLAAVDGYKEFLRAASAKDLQRYFAAHGDIHTQDLVRGAMTRNTYLLSVMKEKSAPKETKLTSLRYGN